MKSIYLRFILLYIFSQSSTLFGQKSSTTYIFGHSLIHHEFQIEETPSQETSMPHWFQLLSEEGGHSFSVSGQYGFLPQHAQLPPSAQWGFDIVPPAWDSENETFGDADFSNILITPANFVQWQSPYLNYPNENLSPISATTDIFEWCINQEENLSFYIYENWPDMAQFLNNNFPPTDSEWNNYNDFLNGEFHAWFLEYHDGLVEAFPNSCIKMIPVGPIISEILHTVPFNNIPIKDLYEDDAPHGKSSIYFLSAMINYMVIYNEKTPTTFPEHTFIHPIINMNYEMAVDLIWEALNAFNYSNGENRAFCNISSSTFEKLEQLESDITIYPNPSRNAFTIDIECKDCLLEVYDSQGIKVRTIQTSALPENKILEFDTPGLYFTILKNKNGKLVNSQKLVFRK